MPSFEKHIVRRKAICIQTGKGSIKTDKALIKVIPITFADIKRAFHTLYKEMVALEEIDAMYVGSSLMYDLRYIVHQDYYGMYLRENNQIFQIPVKWKRHHNTLIY